MWQPDAHCFEQAFMLASYECNILDPILFILYTADLVGLIDLLGLHPHLYADDTQIYGSCSKSAVDEFQQRLSACTDDVASCRMHVNRLQLNTDKSELVCCIPRRGDHQLSSTPIRIGPDFITPSANARDLGIHLDCDLNMRSHVRMTVASRFAVLRQLRSVRRSVPASVYQTLVVALELPKLEYGNATLIGLPASCQYDRPGARLPVV
jgi:hypothetical protein